MVRWREPGIAAALGSGEHAVHLLCRSTSIIPIRIVAIYMTDTSLLYPYSLLNQNQTDPINIFFFIVDLKGVEPSSLILSWYYQQVVLCESRRFRAFNQMVLSLQHTPYNYNMNMISKNNCYYLCWPNVNFLFFYKYNKFFLNIKILLQLFCKNNIFLQILNDSNTYLRVWNPLCYRWHQRSIFLYGQQDLNLRLRGYESRVLTNWTTSAFITEHIAGFEPA